MLLIKQRVNFILGHFLSVHFLNSNLQKDPGIYNMLLGECSYTFGSIVRSVGQV